MIAQRKLTNDVVELSDEATVQAAVSLLSRQPTLLSQRWLCETCGMIHTGSMPDSCDSCGGSVALAHKDAVCREMGSHW